METFYTFCRKIKFYGSSVWAITPHIQFVVAFCELIRKKTRCLNLFYSHIHTHLFTAWLIQPQTNHPSRLLFSFPPRNFNYLWVYWSTHRESGFNSYKPTPVSWCTAHNTRSLVTTKESLYGWGIPQQSISSLCMWVCCEVATWSCSCLKVHVWWERKQNSHLI